MRNFNAYLNSHFAGCPVLLELRDDGRGRLQRVHDIGEKEYVGVSDGTDAWVSPAATFERFKLRELIGIEVTQRGAPKTNKISGRSAEPRRAVLRTRLESCDAGVDS